jgi:tRNA(Ile)-lysidine synthase
MTESKRTLHKVAQFIREQNLAPIGTRLIVGVSGGSDSVTLLHILHYMGYQCLVAHCNFQLRGEESKEDELFVFRLTQQMNVPFYHVSFDTKEYAEKEAISIEMAARDLRYEWFEILRQTLQADAIAVGHHADDAIETFFINLTRGTGLRGLTGIQARNEFIIRPLLCLNRKEIDQYILENRLSNRTDSTNHDQTILRNKVRHQLIPLLEKMNPSFRLTMRKNMAQLYEASSIINQHLEQSISQLVQTDGKVQTIDIVLLMQTKNPHFTLFELLHPYHFNSATIQSIYESLTGISGKQFFSPTHRLIKDRNQLLLLSIEQVKETSFFITQSTSILQINENLTLEISQSNSSIDISIEKRKEAIIVDADKLHFPLEVRHPQPGDFFYPFGNKGKKKLSDFFVDLKWNLYQKEQVWLLLSGDAIVWVIGERLDDRFKIDKQTNKIYKIRIL